MVKIEILIACSGLDFSYYHGEVVEVDPERAVDLVKHGLARYPETASVAPTGKTATLKPAGQTATVKPVTQPQTRRR